MQQFKDDLNNLFKNKSTDSKYLYEQLYFIQQHAINNPTIFPKIKYSIENNIIDENN